jgi:signal transduction histidine kinase
MFLTDNRYRDWIVAAIIGALVAGAFIMTNLSASSSAADDAAALRATDLTIAAEDLAMVTIGQAIAVAEGASGDTFDPVELGAAADAAEMAVLAVGERFEAIPAGETGSLAADLDDWQSVAGRIVAASRIGDEAGAAAAFSDELLPAEEALSSGLIDLRDEYAAAVSDARGWLAYAMRLAGFVFIFMLPLAAIVAHRVSAQRQLATMSELLDSRVAAEAVAGSTGTEQWLEAIRQLSLPVAVIGANAQQLLSGAGDRDPEEAAIVAELHYSAERLAAHLADLRVAVGGDRGITAHPVSIPIARMLDAVVADFSATGRAIGGTYGQGAVSADPDLLEQILRNLISNAVAHGGPDVRIYGDRAGSQYVISVEDNGPGLPQHVADTFAGDPDFGGSPGLGLGVSRKLASAMGGSLEYERIAGRTSLLLSLPAFVADDSERDAAMVAAEG